MASKPPGEQVIWRLAGVRLNPDKAYPEFFCLIWEGGEDRPLLCNDRIVFFTDMSRAEVLIETHGAGEPYDWKDLKEPFFHCDVAEALYVLTNKVADDNGYILGAINLILDLVPYSVVSPPPEYKEILNRTADFFTFSNDVKAFYRECACSDLDVVHAILWCIGAIAVSAVVDP